jgi:Trk K+ transport system NAD-binding subunit
VLSVQGNCASMETLRQAGVEKADLLIAATSADEVNLLCCMTAHGMNPNIHTIARIRNPEYAEQAYSMRDAFALSLAVNPEKQAALEIERLLKYPGFLKRDTFARGRVEIVELRVEEGSRLRNVPLSGLDAIVRCQVLVCAVLRNGHAVAPDGNFVLRRGTGSSSPPRRQSGDPAEKSGDPHAEGPPGHSGRRRPRQLLPGAQSAQAAFPSSSSSRTRQRCTSWPGCCPPPASSRGTPAARRCWRARGCAPATRW